MELWEKKLRNAIRTEIRGLVNEGKLDLTTIADNLELDVSDLLAEADVEAGTVDVTAKDGELHVHVSASAQAAGDTTTAEDVLGDFETTDIGGVSSEEEAAAGPLGVEEEEAEVVSERWQLLAGLAPLNG